MWLKTKRGRLTPFLLHLSYRNQNVNIMAEDETPKSKPVIKPEVKTPLGWINEDAGNIANRIRGERPLNDNNRIEKSDKKDNIVGPIPTRNKGTDDTK